MVIKAMDHSVRVSKLLNVTTTALFGELGERNKTTRIYSALRHYNNY
jgi:hypothetical protein